MRSRFCSRWNVSFEEKNAQLSVFLRRFLPIGRFDSDCDGAWMDSLEGGLSILGKDVAERRLATAEILWGNVRLKTTYGSGIAAFWAWIDAHLRCDLYVARYVCKNPIGSSCWLSGHWR